MFKFIEADSKYKTNTCIYYCILLFIISVFIKNAPVITNTLVGLIFVFSLIKTENILSTIFKNKITLGFVLFYFSQFITLLWTEDITAGFDTILSRLPLLIFPIAFSLIKFETKTWHRVLLFYSLIVSIACFLGFSNSIYLAHTLNDAGYLYNDNISSFLFNFQSVYFSFYVNCAILILFYLLMYTDVLKKTKALVICLIFYLLFIVFMLASKTSMFSLAIILGFITLNYLIKNKKIFESVILVFGVIVFGFIIYKISPKTLSRFNGLTQTSFKFDNLNKENHFNAEFDKSKWSSTNTRVAIWKCSSEIFKENPIIGVGIGDVRNSLMSKYSENNFIYGFNTRKNTHNQYIDIALGMGVLGLLMFLFTFFFMPIKLFLKQKQFLALNIFVCLAICLLTENMINRYQGIIIISFLLPLVDKLKYKTC
ncbi:MAG: O-antigen ligase family protein [Bacteroidota bacterium]